MGTQMTRQAIETSAGNAVAGLLNLTKLLTVHVAKDVTEGDLLGKTSFWGQQSGSGPTILRRSIDWANGHTKSKGTSDLVQIGTRYGGLVDLWPCSTKLWKALFAPMVKLLRLALHKQVSMAVSSGAPSLLVLHSRLVAAVVLNGFEHSRLVEKHQDRDGILKDKELEESSLKNAGRLSLVSFPPQGSQPAQTVLAICVPDSGIVKYDPVFRRNWLELIDLVNLKIRVTQQVLQGTAGQSISPVVALQRVKAECARLGLDAMISDVRDRLTFKQTFVGSTRTKAAYKSSSRYKEQISSHCKTTLAPLLQKDRSRSDRFKAGPQVVEQVLQAVQARLEHTWRAVDRVQDAALWELRVIEELEEMRLLPRSHATFQSWSNWVLGLSAGTDIFYAAAGSQRNKRTDFALLDGQNLFLQFF